VSFAEQLAELLGLVSSAEKKKRRDNGALMSHCHIFGGGCGVGGQHLNLR